jgi:GT2 family glycosyltransferase
VGTGLDITVVAPTYQRAARVERLVRALERQTLPRHRFDVVVVDDASTDGTAAELARLAAASPLQLRTERTDRNRGPAAARNLGWRATDAPVVAFVDDDCVPEPGWLEAMARAFGRNPRLGVAQGRTAAAAGPRDLWTLARVIGDETPWFEGCNIGYRRQALERTGGFDEEIRWYGEDTAAGWKVVEAGWERDFVPDAVVTHDLDVRRAGWRLRHAWLEKNLVLLAGRHRGLRASLWRPWAFRPESVTLPLAVAGALAASRRPALLLLALPYARARWPLLRRPRDLAAFVAIDAVAVAAHVRGSVAAGVLVL